MKPCKHTGCNAPQSECAGVSLHRVDTSHLPDDRAAIVIGNTDPASQFYSRRESEMHIDFAGEEPIQWIQTAVGYVVALLVVLAIVAFNAEPLTELIASYVGNR